MDIRFQVALENALLYAHQLMRQVSRALAPTLRRDVRAQLRTQLRLAENLLRRAICLLAADMAGDLPPPRHESVADASRSVREVPVGRPATPHGLSLVEPVDRFPITGRAMAVGIFAGLSNTDMVPAVLLVARLKRLQATLANPIVRARRLALWRRRQKGTGRKVLRRRLCLPRPVGEMARHLFDWLVTIDADAREALRLEPG